MPESPAQIFARFWSQVAVGEAHECWPYLGGCDPDGYGIFSIGRKSYRAHRRAFAYGHGSEAAGHACHTCHNPPCCNPAHLYDGTAKSNSDDMFRAGREKVVYVSGERHRNAKLSDDDVREIRQCLSLGQKGNALAKRFNVTTGLISQIRNRKIWAHI